MKSLSLCVGLMFVLAMISSAPLRAALPQTSSQTTPPTKPQKIKLVGCLEFGGPLSSAAAINASQVTAFTLTGIDPTLLKSMAASAGMDINASPEVRLRKGDEFDLLDHVGRRVQVTGKFADRAVAPLPLVDSVVVTSRGTVTWIPVIEVSSLHTVADTCR